MHKAGLKGNLLTEYVFTVISGNLEHAGEASSRIKETLKGMQMDKGLIRRVCISSYEAEINIIIHSYGGKIILQLYPDEVMIIAQDTGPGIKDLERALKDGYSTAPDHVIKQGFGAGRGFSNIIRYSDGFSIYSIDGKGTKLELKFKISNETDTL